jgi:hypothetical protein
MFADYMLNIGNKIWKKVRDCIKLQFSYKDWYDASKFGNKWVSIDGKGSMEEKHVFFLILRQISFISFS